MCNIASIDLGSHTARLLIARVGDDPGSIKPLMRKRSYLYLARDFDPVLKRISAEASARAATILKDFSRAMAEWHVKRVVAVATGVVRKAANKTEFLAEVFEKSGLRVKTISGEREALLTGKGALGALDINEAPSFIFDLGGGTTEFLCHGEAGTVARSISLGAMVLTKAFLKSDPPLEREMKALKEYIDQVLNRKCPYFPVNEPVIGTGGTVVALCAMQNDILLNEIVPERINGLKLTLFQIESCLEKMRPLTVARRIERLGLDSGRSQVMVAGAVVVARLLRHLNAEALSVSMSDLLEGALMDFLEGEQHG
jgi:exopolyphosphatase / guanosine-5'-triphosphate,3'-diphosphate pyrophosphatase